MYIDNIDDVQAVYLTYDPFGYVDLSYLYNIDYNRYVDWDEPYNRIFANGNPIINTFTPVDSTIKYDYKKIDNIDKISKDKIKKLLDDTGYRLYNLYVYDFNNDGNYEAVVNLETNQINSGDIVYYETYIITDECTLIVQQKDGDTIKNIENGRIYKIAEEDDGTYVFIFTKVFSPQRTKCYNFYACKELNKKSFDNQISCDDYSTSCDGHDLLLYYRDWGNDGEWCSNYADIKDGKIQIYNDTD